MPFLVTYLNKKAALVTFYIDVLVTPRANDVFNSVYKFGVGQSTVVCWAIVSVQSAIAMYGALFYDASRPYSAMEAGLFAGFHRFFWALGMSAFIIIVIFGKVPIINPLLSSKVMISLGNLVYGLVLVHPIYQYWGLGSLRRPEYLQYYSAILTGAGDIFLSLITALAHLFDC
ncbi:hypothetical protein L9F63_010097 [Diploptera punctata]|uniref:Uncharacterized protein n=1 Tax=Diploptera punctata TaxID=6984 RepID=A0AAD8EQY3_DIPPU|nr:hypothetical protein L9F63_010097 [Diploptera punctata]